MFAYNITNRKGDIMSRPHEFTLEQEEIIKKEIPKGVSYTELGRRFGVNHQVIKSYCKRNNLKNVHRFWWSDERVKKLTELYNYGKHTNREIAEILGTTRDSVCGKVSLLGLKKDLTVVYKMLNEEEKQFIRDNSFSMTITEMSKKLDRHAESISKFIAQENLPIKLRKFDYFIQDEQFMEDIKNPAYSHSYVGAKYGVTGGVISKWRKKLFGDFKSMTDTFLCKSTAELEFEKIINDLDIAFFYEEKICGWKIDYYLGHRVCVEIQGEYWHSLDKVKEKDDRKINELKTKGYIVIEIQEENIHKNKSKVKKQITDAYLQGLTRWQHLEQITR